MPTQMISALIVGYLRSSVSATKEKPRRTVHPERRLAGTPRACVIAARRARDDCAYPLLAAIAGFTTAPRTPRALAPVLSRP